VIVCPRFCDRQGEQARPRAWCTNLPAETDDERRALAGLAGLRSAATTFWDELRYGRIGATGYRGLSVKGWERHCALVTAAQAFRIQAGIGEPPLPLRLPPGRPSPSGPVDWRAAVDRSLAPCRHLVPA
jgi:hypothetical protein